MAKKRRTTKKRKYESNDIKEGFSTLSKGGKKVLGKLKTEDFFKGVNKGLNMQ